MRSHVALVIIACQFHALAGNCLKANPKIIDGIFNPVGLPYDDAKFNEDFSGMIELFSTRFKRPHVFTIESVAQMESVAKGIAKYKYSSSSDIQVYLNTPAAVNKNDTNATIEILKEAYNTVVEINDKNPDLISGMYVETSQNSLDLHFAVMYEAFGPIQLAGIPLGLFYTNCPNLFSEPEEIIVNLRKLSFITCLLDENVNDRFLSPETEAVKVIEECSNIGKQFKERNISGEIMCLVTMPSNKLCPDKANDPLLAFEKFWCKVVSEVKRRGVSLVFFSAFDFPSFDSSSACHPDHHTGWWKRLDEKSNNVKSFVEKVDLLNAYENSHESSRGYVVIIFVSGAVNVLLLLITGTLFYRNRSRVNPDNDVISTNEIKLFELGSASSGTLTFDGQQLPYDKSYEIPKVAFKIDWHTLLGKGAHGAIYKGTLLETNNSVAIKTSRLSKTAVMQILSEIKILIYVGTHENVLSILGANTSDIRIGIIYLVSEFCQLGSLYDVLKNQIKLEALTSIERYSRKQITFQALADQWAEEIAAGMQHISYRKVIHADLATRNVLLDSRGTAKITDFGLSRKMYAYAQYIKKHQEPLPWRWMALESLKSMVFSTESDVWSYGITLFEIYSKGELPYPGMAWNLSFLELLENGLINLQPRFSDVDRFNIMKSCWSLDPKTRPTFQKLRDEFCFIKESDRCDSDVETNFL